MLVMIRLLLVTLFLTLGGCSSVEDFQKMSPASRAHKVCNDDPTIYRLASSIRRNNYQINELDDLLVKGYSTTQSCRTTVSHGGQKNKDGSYVLRERKTCVDNQIPLTQYAINKYSADIVNLTLSTKKLSVKSEVLLSKCLVKTSTLSAEQAFNIYDNQ